MKYKLIIFDLDGTLLDTLGDLTITVNTLLERHGFPLYDKEAIKTFVGQGAERLLSRILPAHRKHLSRDYLPEFLQIYHSLEPVAALYDGIPELLDSLVASGMQLAIVSNKPAQATAQCVTRFFRPWTFCAALGNEPGLPLKPSPEGVRRILHATGLCAADALFIGDSETDIETARNAEMDSISVLWGFRSAEQLTAAGATRLVSTPDGLRAVLVSFE